MDATLITAGILGLALIIVVLLLVQLNRRAVRFRESELFPDMAHAGGGSSAAFFEADRQTAVVTPPRPTDTYEDDRDGGMDAYGSGDEPDAGDVIETSLRPQTEPPGRVRGAAGPTPFRPLPLSPSGNPAATLVASIVAGQGELTQDELRRLELYQPDKLLAAVDEQEQSLTGKDKERRRARLAKVRQHAQALAQQQPMAQPATVVDEAPPAGAAGAVEATTEPAAPVEPTPAEHEPAVPDEPTAEEPAAEPEAAAEAAVEPEPSPGRPTGKVMLPGEAAKLEDLTLPGYPVSTGVAPLADEVMQPEAAPEGGATIAEPADMWQAEETHEEPAAAWPVEEPDEEPARPDEPESRPDLDAVRAADEVDAHAGAQPNPEPFAFPETVYSEYEASEWESWETAGPEPVEDRAVEPPGVEEIEVEEEPPGEVELPAVAAETEVTGTSGDAEHVPAALPTDAAGLFEDEIRTAEDVVSLPQAEQVSALAFLEVEELDRTLRLSGDPELKRAAIDLLEELGSSTALPALNACLEDPDPAIQLYALEATERLLDEIEERERTA